MTGFNFSDLNLVGTLTPPAPSGIAATYIGSAITSNGAPITFPVTLLAGQRYVLLCSMRGASGAGMAATVNGTSATSRIESPLHDGSNLTALFDVVPAADGNQVQIAQGTAFQKSAHIWSIPNGAAFQRGAASANTNGQLVRDVSLTVNAGELVIAGGGARSLDGLLSMTLAGVVQQGLNRHANALIAVGGDAGNVGPASPRTVTLTRGSDTGGFTAVAGAWA